MSKADEQSPRFRAAVHREIDRINDRPGLTERRRAKGGYGPYNKTNVLNLSWLAELVSMQEGSSLSADDVYQRLIKNARTLPADYTERLRFVALTQEALEECARVAGVGFTDVDLPLEVMGVSVPLPGLAEFPDHDPEKLGFFRISMWNPGRRMVERRNVGKIQTLDAREDYLPEAPKPKSWILDPARYNRAVADAKSRSKGSPCPTLVGYQVDERESDSSSDELGLFVSKTFYSDHVGLRDYLRADHAAYETVRGRILERTYRDGRSETLRDVIRAAPDSNIVINVTVQSRAGRVMVIRRPTGATVWAGFHQAGAHETMNWPGPQEEPENWFALARRALREEIGLADPADYYGNIVFSWFGFYAVEGSGYFFAHVHTPLSERELVRRVARAEGAIEAEAVEWLTLDHRSVQDVVDSWRNGPWEQDAVPDSRGRVWLPHSTMSLTQLFRVTGQGMFPDR